MSNTLKISLWEGRVSFRPGETVSGRADWSLDHEPKSLSVCLFWHTSGKGTEDVGVVQTIELSAVQQGGAGFEFVLPAGPYSFSGSLISLIWSIELVAAPSKEMVRQDIVVSPTGNEVNIHKS